MATGKKEGDLRLGWSVGADGVPYDVAPIGTEYADDPATKCIVKALAGWKFPKRKEPTLHIDFPIRFAALKGQCRPGASRPVRATYSVYPPP